MQPNEYLSVVKGSVKVVDTNSNNTVLIKRGDDGFEVNKELKNDGEMITIVVNNHFVLEVKRTDVGYVIDGWKNPSEDEDALLFSDTVWDDDLE